MYTADKYSMIRMTDQYQEIDAAIKKVTSKPKQTIIAVAVIVLPSAPAHADLLS